MKLLLPHRFKKMGLIIAPLGFIFWFFAFRGIFGNLFLAFFSKFDDRNGAESFNVAFGFTGFFLFVMGMLCLVFSKEKVDDEMVKLKRLESLQFASILQLLIVFIGVETILFFKLHSKDFVVAFFTLGIITFWISFVFRFNYLLHAKFKN